MEGWKLEKKPINWDSKDMELNSGSIDCIWNGFTMNGREDDYTFSVPYVDNSQVIVVAEDSGIESLEDLAGKQVGVQAVSYTHLVYFPGGSKKRDLYDQEEYVGVPGNRCQDRRGLSFCRTYTHYDRRIYWKFLSFGVFYHTGKSA